MEKVLELKLAYQNTRLQEKLKGIDWSSSVHIGEISSVTVKCSSIQQKGERWHNGQAMNLDKVRFNKMLIYHLKIITLSEIGKAFTLSEDTRT